MNERRPPTIRDLAKLLGVSDATVSLALRNHPSISVPTRERVQAMAKKLNYRSNVLINALMAQVRSGRVNTSGEVIALLMEGAEPHRAPSLVRGEQIARQRAAMQGLRLEVFQLGQLCEGAGRVDRVLFNRGIRGVIVGPMPIGIKPVKIDWGRYACLAVGYSFQQQKMHRVAHAHFFGAITCYRELIRAGYKRIGCVLDRDDDERARHFWQAAARSAPHIHGGAKIPPLLMSAPFDRSSFEKWLERHSPDAVIGNSPDHAARWIAQLKRDLCYTSLDLKEGVAWGGIRQSWDEIYNTAVDQLAGEMARNEFGLPQLPRVTLIEGEWVAGNLEPPFGSKADRG